LELFLYHLSFNGAYLVAFEREHKRDYFDESVARVLAKAPPQLIILPSIKTILIFRDLSVHGQHRCASYAYVYRSSRESQKKNPT